MLENWLQPSALLPKVHYQPYQFGAQLLRYAETFPNLQKVQLAIIGIQEMAADKVRESLYECVFPFKGLQVADLGNARKQDIGFLIPLFSELLQGGITPIIIGHDDIFTLAQFQAYQFQKDPINLVVVDERIRFSENFDENGHYLYTLLKQKNQHLFHCAVLGFQSHFTAPSTLDFFEKNYYEYVRLGKIRNDIEEAEPVVRNADVLSFQIAALKYSDAGAVAQPTPSGLSSEEACQICRYAGINDKLSSFGIYGYQAQLDTNKLTAQTIAQMIWYFIDGFYQRKHDYPVTMNHLVEYIVSYRDANYQLTFWKSNKSGRWWMQVPLKTKKKHARHRLIPCTFTDYQLAIDGELPERLLSAYKRFSM